MKKRLCTWHCYHEEEGEGDRSVPRGRTVLLLLFTQRGQPAPYLFPPTPTPQQQPRAAAEMPSRGKQLFMSRAVQVGRRVWSQLQILFHLSPSTAHALSTMTRVAPVSAHNVYWAVGRRESACFFVTMIGGRHFY